MYIILSRKKCITVCLIAVFLSISAFGIFALSSYAGTFFDDKSLSIIVDAGHGLPDGGAVGSGGTVEQEINIAIAKKLEEVLEGKNIDVIMTRSDESGIWTEESDSIRKKKVEDMYNRLKIMKNSDADLFVSIHMNSYTNKATSGLRIFYSPAFDEIKPLAENIQIRMSDVTGAKTNVVKAADNSLFLMKKAPIPAILVECGFISNPQEEKKLNDEDYQARLAWAIADAVEKYYSLP